MGQLGNGDGGVHDIGGPHLFTCQFCSDRNANLDFFIGLRISVEIVVAREGPTRIGGWPGPPISKQGCTTKEQLW